MTPERRAPLVLLPPLLLAVACQPPAPTPEGDSSGGAESGGDDGGDVRSCGDDPLPPVAGDTCEVTPGNGGGVRLRGTVLDATGILRAGEVVFDDTGHITCVDCDCSQAPGAADATVVSCGQAVISPALINPHDHITYANNAPIGQGPDRYDHRHQWRKGQDGHVELDVNNNASRDEVLAAELRFVMGGATAAASAGGETGLLRNLDTGGKLQGLPAAVADSDTFPLDDSSGEQRTEGCDYGSSPTTAASIQGHAYLPHVAEGINAAAHNEFVCVSDTGPQDLIGPRTALVHGIALEPADVATMQAASAMLVWSPRSNVVLYGNTAPVTMMDAMGLPIALGTDWVASGSMNLLRELACADALDRDAFGDHFSDRALWQMVTANAARATGTSAVLGTLAPGYFADIAVFRSRDGATDHRAVIDAGSDDVLLVLRAGEPLYGDAAVLAGLGAQDCETLDVCGTDKRACVARDTGGSSTLAGVRAAIEAYYPLFFCGEPDDEPSCMPYRPGAYAGAKADDADGDGLDDATDDCPTVFNPIRGFEVGQGDADGDGAGDACDRCPLDADDACP